MEKVRAVLPFLIPFDSGRTVDQLQGRKRKGIYDTPNQSRSQVHDARLRPHEVVVSSHLHQDSF
jgi:hypothetical protein